MNVVALHALQTLDALSRERALTDEESDQLARAHSIERQRQRRLPQRIMRLRRELHEAEADLWPCHLPTLRALEAQEEADRLARLEDELDIAPAESAVA